MPLPVPVELDWPQSGSGLLAQSRSLPEGWTRGISFLDVGCLTPFAVGECPTGTDLKEAQRADAVVVRPVQVGQAIECSGLDNRTDWGAVAGGSLDRTRDYGLTSELLTGLASRRDASADGGDGNFALVNGETIGAQAAPSIALACLEKAILSATADAGAVIFVPVEVGQALVTANALIREGARWRTAAGSLVIISAAIDGRTPVAYGEESAAPEPGDELFIYGTAAVWAATGTRDTLLDVDRSVNTKAARAEDVALVAISPCSTFATETTVTACAD